jgi:hypothetical protein
MPDYATVWGMVVLDLHTKLSATGAAGMDRPTGYTEVSTALSAAGVWALVLAFLDTTTDIARRRITPAMCMADD